MAFMQLTRIIAAWLQLGVSAAAMVMSSVDSEQSPMA